MEFQLFHTTLSASLLIFIMAGGFLAGFVDSIAGGGGLRLQPASARRCQHVQRQYPEERPGRPGHGLGHRFL